MPNFRTHSQITPAGKEKSFHFKLPPDIHKKNNHYTKNNNEFPDGLFFGFSKKSAKFSDEREGWGWVGEDSLAFSYSFKFENSVVPKQQG